MVPNARRLALSVLSLTALLALSGCGELGRAIHEAVIFVMVLIVVAIVFQVVVVVVGTVGIVMLARGTPSLRWGIAAIVCGVLQVMLIGITGPNGLHAISVIEVIALLVVGIRNVMIAPRRAAPAPPRPEPDDDLT